MNKDYRTEMLDRLSSKKPEVAQIRYTEGYNAAILVARSIIATTLPKGVELRPVVHAHWVREEGLYGIRYSCSNCNEELPVVCIEPSTVYHPYGNWESIEPTDYCPCCGAEMEEIKQ